MAGNGIIRVPSSLSVEETLHTLQATLESKAITIFATIDHSGEAAKVGLRMPPTKLLIFGNPKGGTPLMLAAPSSAIDLPLKLLIAEDEQGKVWISYNTPEYLAERHAVPQDLLKKSRLRRPAGSQRLSLTLHQQITTLAQQAGFAAAGIAPIPPPGDAADYPELSHFEPWIEQGRAGEMEYLKRRDDANRLLRSSLRVALPWARSVIVCAANYNLDAPKSIDLAANDSGWIARYACTGYAGRQPSDYHDVLLVRLQQMEQELQSLLGPFQSRCYVDTGPLVERVYAKYAGIGWIGKNTCILNQELGSWLFLGVIVTALEPPPAEVRIADDRCGSCTRCIDACPTGALDAPYEMDASLCIAYLTIEKRGSIAEPLRALIGRQVFGCDICQDVCPWNRRAPIGSDPDLAVRAELVNPALTWLAELDAEGFRRLFRKSPLQRTRLRGLLRNVAIAMGNSGLASYVPKLREWADGTDPVLAEAAQWALARCR